MLRWRVEEIFSCDQQEIDGLGSSETLLGMYIFCGNFGFCIQ